MEKKKVSKARERRKRRDEKEGKERESKIEQEGAGVCSQLADCNIEYRMARTGHPETRSEKGVMFYLCLRTKHWQYHIEVNSGLCSPRSVGLKVYLNQR